MLNCIWWGLRSQKVCCWGGGWGGGVMDTEMSQHRRLTLEKKILLPLLQGLEPETFWSRVWHSNHWAIRLPNAARGSATNITHSLYTSPPELYHIKIGSSKSLFSVSLIVRGKVTGWRLQTTTFEETEEPKQGIKLTPSAYQPSTLPLGQSGSCMKNGTGYQLQTLCFRVYFLD